MGSGHGNAGGFAPENGGKKGVKVQKKRMERGEKGVLCVK